MLVLVADEELDVSGTHGAPMEAHSLLCVVRRVEGNVRLAGGAPVAAAREAYTVLEGLEVLEELKNLLPCGAEGQSTHAKEAGVLSLPNTSPTGGGPGLARPQGTTGHHAVDSVHTMDSGVASSGGSGGAAHRIASSTASPEAEVVHLRHSRHSGHTSHVGGHATGGGLLETTGPTIRRTVEGGIGRQGRRVPAQEVTIDTGWGRSPVDGVLLQDGQKKRKLQNGQTTSCVPGKEGTLLRSLGEGKTIA